jgi:hypothetical protein
MIPGLRRSLFWGGVWGAVFLILSAFLGGAGHGVFAPLGVFCAPISLFGVRWAWLGCIPVSMLLAAGARLSLFPFLAALQYVTAILAVTVTPDYADWSELPKLPIMFTMLVGINMTLYVIGHGVLWSSWWAARQLRLQVRQS